MFSTSPNLNNTGDGDSSSDHRRSVSFHTVLLRGFALTSIIGVIFLLDLWDIDKTGHVRYLGDDIHRRILDEEAMHPAHSRRVQDLIGKAISVSVGKSTHPPAPDEFPVWIQAYWERHERAIAKLRETQSSKIIDANKYLVYECKSSQRLCGGLGDRLKGMVMLFYVAMVTGRILLIDAVEPFPLQQTVQPNHIFWNVSRTSLESTKSPSDSTRFIESVDMVHPWLAEATDMDQNARTIIARFNQWTPQTLWSSIAMRAYLKAHGISLGKQGSRPPPQLFKWAFWSMFKKSEALELKMASVRSSIDMDKSPNFIGVHMRLGGQWHDRVRHDTGNNTVDMFAKCSRMMQSLVGESSQPSVYVLSDNSLAKGEFMETLGSGEVRSSPLDAMHVDRPGFAVEANYGIWIDFFMLSESTCMVLSNSGFSRAARDISLGNGGKRCWARFNECSQSTIFSRLSSNLIDAITMRDLHTHLGEDAFSTKAMPEIAERLRQELVYEETHVKAPSKCKMPELNRFLDELEKVMGKSVVGKDSVDGSRD